MLRIRNNRTQLRRNDPEPSAAVQESLDKLSRDAKKASGAEKLLGIEGRRLTFTLAGWTAC